MSVTDVVSSVINALIGSVVVVSAVFAQRVVTRVRRQHWFANRRFMRQYRADHPKGSRTTVEAPPPSSRWVAVRLSIAAGVIESSAATREERRAA